MCAYMYMYIKNSYILYKLMKNIFYVKLQYIICDITLVKSIKLFIL